MDRPVDGIAPGAESSLRAHMIEVEPCWLDVHCGACRNTTIIPCRMLVGRYGPDIEVGAFVSRLNCKRCGVPPATVRLKEQPNEIRGASPGWSVQLIDRTAVSASSHGHRLDAARLPG